MQDDILRHIQPLVQQVVHVQCKHVAVQHEQPLVAAQQALLQMVPACAEEVVDVGAVICCVPVGRAAGRAVGRYIFV